MFNSMLNLHFSNHCNAPLIFLSLPIIGETWINIKFF